MSTTKANRLTVHPCPRLVQTFGCHKTNLVQKSFVWALTRQFAYPCKSAIVKPAVTTVPAGRSLGK